jgi:hypothetical protein
MDSAMTIAGLCVMLAGSTFLFISGLKARRRGTLRDYHSSGQFDLYMAFVWSGLFLVQLNSILLHWEPGAIQHLSALTWAGTGGTVFSCGVFTGRLLLRWEMRRQEDRETLC